MQVHIQIAGLEKVRAQIQKLTGAQMQAATADALNDTAFMLRKEVQADMAKTFDRPTPYVLRSVLVQKALANRLVARIAPTGIGGKGIDPQKILHAEAEGGPRRDKRSELALRAAGILPSGYQTAIPSEPFPGSDDGRGNIKGGFIVRLLAYFQAFGEQGYKANMTKRRKEKLANKSVSAAGFMTINGVQFFVSYGALRGGKAGHLAPGIWARSGTHGVNVRPVLMFVQSPNYTVRLNLANVLKATDAQAHFEKRLRYRIRLALGQ